MKIFVIENHIVIETGEEIDFLSIEWRKKWNCFQLISENRPDFKIFGQTENDCISQLKTVV